MARFLGRRTLSATDRAPQRDVWHARFPGATAAEIGRFLGLVADALGQGASVAERLSPEDAPLALYRELYGARGVPDALELETLAMTLEDTYGLPPAATLGAEATLGSLFGEARAAGRSKG